MLKIYLTKEQMNVINSIKKIEEQTLIKKEKETGVIHKMIAMARTSSNIMIHYDNKFGHVFFNDIDLGKCSTSNKKNESCTTFTINKTDKLEHFMKKHSEFYLSLNYKVPTDNWSGSANILMKTDNNKYVTIMNLQGFLLL